MNRRFGLIGKPLSHSFSATFFASFFHKHQITDCLYELFELDHIQDVEALFLNIENLVGLNITIPYKESVLSLADHLSEEVKAIGASNCLHIKNGKVYAHNTDYIGFMNSLTEQGFNGNSALVLGAGGSSKAVCYAFAQMNVKTQVVSRNPEMNQWSYERLKHSSLNEFDIVVNTTPIGMSPHINDFLELEYQTISMKTWVYDLIYNPTKTKFLEKAASYGAKIINGERMLEIQALESWKIWNSTHETI